MSERAPKRQMMNKLIEKSDEGKTPKLARTRVKGRLETLMSMCLDIFFGVCICLGPEDLLSLSRTTRQLRAILMSKKTRSIWWKSWENKAVDVIDKRGKVMIAGLVPKCPLDMNEPTLASFLLERLVCKNCGRRTHEFTSISYVLRTMLCVSCRYTMLGQGSILLHKVRWQCGIKSGIEDHAEIFDLGIDYVLFTMVPSFEGIGEIVGDFEEGTLEDPSDDDIDLWDELARNNYNRRTFRKVAGKFYKLFKAGRREELRGYVSTMQQEVNALEEVAIQWEKWDSQRYENKRMLYEKRKNAFADAARAKLLDIGYTQRDFSREGMTPSRYDELSKLLYQRKIMTPRIWKNLQPKLEKLLGRK